MTLPSEAGEGLIPAVAGVDRSAKDRRLAVRGLLGSGLAVGLLLIGLGVTLRPAFFVASLPVSLLGLFCLAVVLATGGARTPRLTFNAVRFEGRLLRLGAPSGWERTFSVDDVVQGHVEEPDLVRLSMRGGEVVVVKVPDADDRRRLLRVAHVTAAERRLRLPLPSAASQVPGGTAFCWLFLSFLLLTLLFWLAVVGVGATDVLRHMEVGGVLALIFMVAVSGGLGAAAYGVASALLRREVVVGVDGLAYKKTLGREFIPYASLSDVLPDTRGVMLVRRDGRRLVLPMRTALQAPLPTGPGVRASLRQEEVAQRVLLDRVREATAPRAPVDVARGANQLDRNGRSPQAWREDLLRIATRKGDYRSSELSTEDLAALVENPDAPAERRIAAALTLGASGDEPRARVRVAAPACADEDMQAALEAAAEGDIDEERIARVAGRQAAAPAAAAPAGLPRKA